MKTALKENAQRGAIFALALIALTATIVITVALLSRSLTYKQSSRYSLNNLEATALAEAGMDKAIASLNATGGSYNGESETSLGNGSYGVTITSKNPSTVLIRSTGYIPNKTNPKTKQTIEMEASKGQGISFVYGLLVGNGGITMGNGSRINGSIYANGSIIGGNNELITGDVYVAGGTAPTANQENSCSEINCADFYFGKNIAGNNQLDVAQSFRPSLPANSSAVVNKVSLRLKKVGNPSDMTVRLLGDNNGKPNKSNVLTSKTLLANLVTSQYGFVDVAFINPPQLNADTTYWIVIDATSNNSNYWAWSLDSLGGYTRGSAVWSPDWQTNNPVWNTIAGDLDFKIWLGGVTTSLSMNNGSVIQGHVHANTIQGVTINKDAYYQVISNSTVQGRSYPNSPDPGPVAMPISDTNIGEWKDEAQVYGTIASNVNGCPSRLGPGVIEGNVTIGNNCTVIVTPPIWIKGTGAGNLTFGNSSIFKMDPSLGAYSGVIIADGRVIFQNGDDLIGSGTEGSYLTILSTYNSQQNGITAIDTGNSSITGILYAPNGIISLANNANFKEAVAWKINMGTSTVLTYDSGLISTFFSAGPGGAFSAVKGTYQLK